MMKNLKVLLINPPFPYQLVTTARDVHQAMEGKPPLGILSIGTYLRTYTQFEVRLLDNQIEQLGDSQLIRFLNTYQPDVVGITVVTFKLYPAYLLTKQVRKCLPQAHICWGGPHVSLFPKESLRLPGVDSVILGDGEIPFADLCTRLAEQKNVDDLPGVYTLRNEPAKTSDFQLYRVSQLDSLPLLDLTLLPYQKYRAFLSGNLLATAVTSRGCPHRCIFCKLDISHIRLMSMRRVVEQLEQYVKLGITEIEFYDETFNISTERVLEFANLVLEKKLRLQWSFRGRVNAVTAEMCQMIKQSGCQRIQYGVESGVDRVLTILKKGITREMIENCFALTGKAKIDTVAYFIIGTPTETLEEMNETIRFARHIKPTYLEYAIFHIFPGTESYTMALNEEIIDRDYWREYAAAPGPVMPILTWNRPYSFTQLEAVRKKAMRDFYSRPSYIIDRIIHLKPNQILRSVRTGISMLRQ